MKALKFSVKLILILLVLVAISFTSCKKDTSKDDTTKKEEQVTKKINGEEFVGEWFFNNPPDSRICKIIKSGDLYILDYYSFSEYYGTRLQRSCAYNYSNEVLTGNDKIFFDSKDNCIYYDGHRYVAMKK